MKRSYWQETQLPSFPSLASNLQVDIAVVGGGLTGITAAYLLKKAGFKVALFERDSLAGVDSGHTTAHVTQVTDLGLADLTKNFGANHAEAVWDAGAAAMEQIHKNTHAEQIDCDFRWVPAYLHTQQGSTKSDDDYLRNEAELALKYNIECRILESVPLMKRFGIRFGRQALYHPLKYLSGLVNTIPGDGCHVFEGSEVTEFKSDPLRLTIGKHEVTCGKVVVATHVPLTGTKSFLSAGMFQSKLAPYTSYAISALLPEIKDGAAASYWDTGDPYFYLRLDPAKNGFRAVYGGLDHKTGQIDESVRYPFEVLTDKLVSIFPEAQIESRWSGQVIETHDGLPYIGPVNDEQFISTGYSGNGMTFGTLGAMMATDWATGKKNPWSELFHPDRKKLRGATWDYIKENLDYPYYMLKERWLYKEGKSVEELERGQGKILLIDGERLAVYRDGNGNITKLSPVCTHLGCLVHWNGADCTWDCPCHGSRFRPSGEVFAGPAESPLEKREK